MRELNEHEDAAFADSQGPRPDPFARIRKVCRRKIREKRNDANRVCHPADPHVPRPRFEGWCQHEEGSWTKWALFDNEDIGADFWEDEGENDRALCWYLTGWSCDPGWPGSSYEDRPYKTRGKFHTLVTQSGGVDI